MEDCKHFLCKDLNSRGNLSATTTKAISDASTKTTTNATNQGDDEGGHN